MLDYQSVSISESAPMAHPPPNMMPYQHPQHLPPSNSDHYFYPPDSTTVNNRQPFGLNTAPLAALHSMTDMKASQSPTSPTSAVASYNSAAYYSMKHCLNAAATPHGITDILSRPDLQAQLQARLGQGVYYNSCSQSNNGSVANLSPTSKEMSANRSLYHWPSNAQVLPPGHAAWHSKHGGMVSFDGKDGKKKNTRPTFSGSQIFALEKTFEQQKYLAGPERGRLAYALGMSESQVKVWFQNRRTKWRKRHAADMATSKRRPEPETNAEHQTQYVGTNPGSNSAADSSNHETMFSPSDADLSQVSHPELPL